MSKLKYLFIFLIIIFQFSAIFSLFLNKTFAIFLFICYGLSIIGLIAIYVKERIKEKREEDEHDYSDY
ncbi:hypothetical protein [Bacillus sp. Marseille-P3661]|uniref:hypothetical protein n=1 Tax=Bacillus sp. Marseille-P3661 TaxID=1936234 RepID=UPI000C81A785|nr:hypothetical protein [Bacillus sp. Marseille-P3661]